MPKINKIVSTIPVAGRILAMKDEDLHTKFFKLSGINEETQQAFKELPRTDREVGLQRMIFKSIGRDYYEK